MPLYVLQCLNGHKKTEFCHVSADKGCTTHLCDCGGTMGYVFSPGTPLVYFGEGGAGKWIYNMGHEPVFITSHAQHQREMKKRGLTWATPKHGMPGSWA